MKSKEEIKLYSLSEVALRNGKDSNECWIVIKDSVYSVGNFIDQHPGTPDLILEHGGKDCTKEFNDVAHSNEAIKDLKGLKIGELIEVSWMIKRVKIFYRNLF